jgi:microcystin degradation protein MlrC
MDQGVEKVLISALTDEPALEAIWGEDIQPGDSFDMEVGGYTGDQAGDPVKIKGELVWRGSQWGYDKAAAIAFGDGNMLLLAPGYQQNSTPARSQVGPVDPAAYDVFVLKSRVHFRRGFDETGYAKTILIVDAPGDWFGTVRLDALDYQNVDIEQYYPFGNPNYDPSEN